MTISGVLSEVETSSVEESPPAEVRVIPATPPSLTVYVSFVLESAESAFCETSVSSRHAMKTSSVPATSPLVAHEIEVLSSPVQSPDMSP
jgi:hypothetical protein